MTRDSLLSRLADLAVTLGANVQPGQILTVAADHGQYEVARAIAESGYRHGAVFVDVQYFDPYVKHARITHADADTLGFVPSWYGQRVLALIEERGARITLDGPSAPGLMDDLDPDRAGRDMLPTVKEIREVVERQRVNWVVVPCPTLPWAELVYPDLAPDEAFDRLWEEVAHVCRLDEPDPVAAWKERLDALQAMADSINAREFDAIHFEGPGTDLVVGLLPTSTFHGVRDRTDNGIEFLSNIPTEEVYTTPDPERVDGHVRSTRPLVLGDGTLVRGLEVRFEGGRAVQIDAQQGAGVLRARAASDDGASRLGEVALVDREGRIDRLGTVFYNTLLDENAASHIALGEGWDESVSDEDRARCNRSAIHIDFMIGGDDVDVTGVTRDGGRVPLLRGGLWQI